MSPLTQLFTARSHLGNMADESLQSWHLGTVLVYCHELTKGFGILNRRVGVMIAQHKGGKLGDQPWAQGAPRLFCRSPSAGKYLWE